MFASATASPFATPLFTPARTPHDSPSVTPSHSRSLSPTSISLSLGGGSDVSCSKQPGAGKFNGSRRDSNAYLPGSGGGNSSSLLFTTGQTIQYSMEKDSNNKFGTPTQPINLGGYQAEPQSVDKKKCVHTLAACVPVLGRGKRRRT